MKTKPVLKDMKKALRKEYKEIRQSIPADQRQERDRAIVDAACAMASFRYAKYVLMYAAMDDEINIYPVAERAMEQGKIVLFPRCCKEDHTMRYHQVTSLDQLNPDSYGISEPSEDAPVYDPERDMGSAICFVPGLVYDRGGHRLGYGKGFYDRFLSSFAGCSIGVIYGDFILKEIPQGKFDMKVNILLTEKGVKMTSED